MCNFLKYSQLPFRIYLLAEHEQRESTTASQRSLHKVQSLPRRKDPFHFHLFPQEQQSRLQFTEQGFQVTWTRTGITIPFYQVENQLSTCESGTPGLSFFLKCKVILIIIHIKVEIMNNQHSRPYLQYRVNQQFGKTTIPLNFRVLSLQFYALCFQGP